MENSEEPENSIINLFEVLGKGMKLFVKPTVLSAFLDPQQYYRDMSINRLQQAYPKLIGGFVSADKQFFLRFQDGDTTRLAYVCDAPKNKDNQYCRTWDFDLRNRIIEEPLDMANFLDELNPNQKENLLQTLEFALFSNNQDFRDHAMQTIRIQVPTIERIVIGDNQIFFKLDENGSEVMKYVCDLPKTRDHLKYNNHTFENKHGIKGPNFDIL